MTNRENGKIEDEPCRLCDRDLAAILPRGLSSARNFRRSVPLSLSLSYSMPPTLRPIACTFSLDGSRGVIPHPTHSRFRDDNAETGNNPCVGESRRRPGVLLTDVYFRRIYTIYIFHHLPAFDICWKNKVRDFVDLL